MQTEMQHDPQEEVRTRFRLQIDSACRQLRRSAFQQEPAYVAALMGKLAGMQIQSGCSWLTTTVANDRGRHSSESEFGADFAVIFESASGVSKAVLGQAKGSPIDSLPVSEKNRFLSQCERIASRTRHFVALEVPTGADTMPIIRKGVSGPPVSIEPGRRLDDYLADVFVACLHGDRRGGFVEAVKTSDLLQLRVMTAD
ncbi:hypothetical protein [Paraburkholderia kururiensis]|uniref:hypothetical protein n=1 Tax=Paraburkholderia kururiensis TaxID=984307 RepID=UPI0012E0AEA1|nr:hypothetical protein [Paraburkholderia kururiensis]